MATHDSKITFESTVYMKNVSLTLFGESICSLKVTNYSS